MKTKNRTGRWLMLTRTLRFGKHVIPPGLTQIVHDSGSSIQVEFSPGHRGFITNADLRQPEYGIEILE